MMILLAIKTFIFVGVMLPLSMGALSTGILFAGYCIAAAKNPEESESLFNSALMAFALIETFVFLSVVISLFVYFL